MLDSVDLYAEASDAFSGAAALACAAPPIVQASTGRGAPRLNPMQRAFARDFVLNGGNSHRAAVTAGYTDASHTAPRLLCHAGVLGEIKRLAIVHTEALLPIALRQLFDIMTDPDADAKARVLAANSILDRGGMRPKSAPLVQVNNLTQVNGADAQALISAVWSARQARNVSVTSDIVAPMSDICEPDQALALPSDPAALPAPTAPPPRGGDAGGGSHPALSTSTPSSPANHEKSTVGWLWSKGVLGTERAGA